MATILLRGNVTPGEVSIPSGPESPIPREPLFAFGGLADMNLAFGNSELAINISSGIGTIPLVSRRRQVELTGIQDVGGRKTFGLANISITGGLAGQVLTTVSPGNLGWANPSAPGANYTFERGLTEDPPGTVSLNIAN